jgi:hypothetical protein
VGVITRVCKCVAVACALAISIVADAAADVITIEDAACKTFTPEVKSQVEAKLKEIGAFKASDSLECKKRTTGAQAPYVETDQNIIKKAVCSLSQLACATQRAADEKSCNSQSKDLRKSCYAKVKATHDPIDVKCSRCD